MELNFSQKEEGIEAEHEGKKYCLRYPEGMWKNYPRKSRDFLFDNLSHLLTINTPLMKEEKEVQYNTFFPLFRGFFSQIVLNSLPHAVEDYAVSAGKMIKKFLNIDYRFKDWKVKAPFYDGDKEEKAVVALSCGKDSLCSLGLARELGLEPIGVYINDTVSPPENKLKIEFLEKIEKELGVKIFKVVNEIEKLNDFETWGKDETCIGYTHMMTGFSLIVLPFNHHFKAKYTIVGNQANMNFRFMGSDGFLSYPSFDQSREGMKQQNIMIGLATKGKVKVVSLIEGLTNLAIMKLLHGKYKELGKYEISCDSLDFCDEKRWCHDCNKCCRLYLMMKALGAEVESVGFHTNLLQRKFRKNYALFGGSGVDAYEKSKEARDEQLLSFYLAYQRGAEGGLMKLFEKDFLKEAEKRERELKEKFFGLGEMTSVPPELQIKLRKILEKELSDEKMTR